MAPPGMPGNGRVETRRTRQITRGLGGVTYREKDASLGESKGPCRVSLQPRQFPKPGALTFWSERREHHEIIRNVMCGALASGDAGKGSISVLARADARVHSQSRVKGPARDAKGSSTRKQTKPGLLPGKKTVRPGLGRLSPRCCKGTLPQLELGHCSREGDGRPCLHPYPVPSTSTGQSQQRPGDKRALRGRRQSLGQNVPVIMFHIQNAITVSADLRTDMRNISLKILRQIPRETRCLDKYYKHR